MSERLRDWSGYDHIGQIIAYEQGDLDDEQAIELFQHLVDTGLAWSMQGSYGRQAARLIEAGLVSNSVDEHPAKTLDDLE